MNKTDAKDWFDEWFDSPYYHILYKDRDLGEAEAFVDRLCTFFGCHPDKHVLDLACGKGRYSRQLYERGMNVTGVDLSDQSIAYARQYENERLHFFVHDMRKVFQENTFDLILNLFTSFGYFSSREENDQVVVSAAKGLKKGGELVIDFFNTPKVIRELVPEETKTIAGITFHISRHVTGDGFIIKDICFEDKGKPYHFQERVEAISMEEFHSYFDHAGLRLKILYGDYHLHDYYEETSDRMIFFLEK